MSDGPSRSYLSKAADAEDVAGCVSAGGLAVDVGQPTTTEVSEIARLNCIIDQLADTLSKWTKQPALTERRVAEKAVHTRPYQFRLSEPVEVARFEMEQLEQDEYEGRTMNPERYWVGQYADGENRESEFDDLHFKPEHFKPGTVVIVMEPR